MRSLIIVMLLLFIAIPVYAGEDIELKITFLVSGDHRLSNPIVRLGKSDVQINFKSPTKYIVELGDFEWDPKDPNDLFHTDTKFDIDWNRIYNRPPE